MSRRFATPQRQPRRRPAALLLLLCACLALLLCLVSYLLPLSGGTPQVQTPPDNWFGSPGFYLAHFLFSLLGFLAFVPLGLLLALLLWRLVRRQSAALRLSREGWIALLGLALTASGLLGSLPALDATQAALPGGLVGTAIWRGFVACFGARGAVVVLPLCGLVALILPRLLRAWRSGTRRRTISRKILPLGRQSTASASLATGTSRQTARPPRRPRLSPEDAILLGVAVQRSPQKPQSPPKIEEVRRRVAARAVVHPEPRVQSQWMPVQEEVRSSRRVPEVATPYRRKQSLNTRFAAAPLAGEGRKARGSSFAGKPFAAPAAEVAAAPNAQNAEKGLRPAAPEPAPAGKPLASPEARPTTVQEVEKILWLDEPETSPAGKPDEASGAEATAAQDTKKFFRLDEPEASPAEKPDELSDVEPAVPQDEENRSEIERPDAGTDGKTGESSDADLTTAQDTQEPSDRETTEASPAENLDEASGAEPAAPQDEETSPESETTETVPAGKTDEPSDAEPAAPQDEETSPESETTEASSTGKPFETATADPDTAQDTEKFLRQDEPDASPAEEPDESPDADLTTVQDTEEPSDRESTEASPAENLDEALRTESAAPQDEETSPESETTEASSTGKPFETTTADPDTAQDTEKFLRLDEAETSPAEEPDEASGAEPAAAQDEETRSESKRPDAGTDGKAGEPLDADLTTAQDTQETADGETSEASPAENLDEASDAESAAPQVTEKFLRLDEPEVSPAEEPDEALGAEPAAPQDEETSPESETTETVPAGNPDEPSGAEPTAPQVTEKFLRQDEPEASPAENLDEASGAEPAAPQDEETSPESETTETSPAEELGESSDAEPAAAQDEETRSEIERPDAGTDGKAGESSDADLTTAQDTQETADGETTEASPAEKPDESPDVDLTTVQDTQETADGETTEASPAEKPDELSDVEPTVPQVTEKFLRLDEPEASPAEEPDESPDADLTTAQDTQEPSDGEMPEAEADGKLDEPSDAEAAAAQNKEAFSTSETPEAEADEEPDEPSDAGLTTSQDEETLPESETTEPPLSPAPTLSPRPQVLPLSGPATEVTVHQPSVPPLQVQEQQVSSPVAPPKPLSRLYEHFVLPPLDILNENPHTETALDQEHYEETSAILVEKLLAFGVQGEVVGISPGPVVTTYEFAPAMGVKISRIMSLADDLAMVLKVDRVRVVGSLPGKAAVGIEIPNPVRNTVYLHDILLAEEYCSAQSKLTLALGLDVVGQPVVTNLAQMPHLLIAGATGSGKSVAINAFIASILFRAKPDEVRLLLIDPKRIELSVYDDIPHLLHPVVVDAKMASRALLWAVHEMERRYRMLGARRVKSIESYNAVAEDPLPYIVIIVDELADLMMVASKDVETSIARLAQMARAAGMHIILATQRPSVDVLTGLIKANFPTRISFKVSSRVDSRTILDGPGAEHLLGMGDMLFQPPGAATKQRIHGAYISEQETERLVTALKDQGLAEYDESILKEVEEDPEAASAESEDDYDEHYDEAVALVTETGMASIAMMQSYLGLGRSRAARLITRMEREGIVGPAVGARRREVLVRSRYDEEEE